jgi:hypothetical protein
MSRGRRAAAWLGAVALALLGAKRGDAQSTISIRVSSLKVDSMPPAPLVTLTSLQNRPDLGPYTVSLELSTEPAFQRPFYVNVVDGEGASFTTDSLLPEHAVIYLRARLTDRFGVVDAEAREQHPVRGWVTLLQPAQQSLVVLSTRKPKFVWQSPPTTLTAGLWSYQLSVINKATGATDFISPFVSDTSYVFPDSLESNASYRWQVRARAIGGKGSGEVTVMSAGTIIIGGDPTFTLLYQNFPNPFGRGTRSPITCFWFDLARPAQVRLTIFDLRLREVRNIIPGPLGDGALPVGVYGRQNIDAQTGCDPRLSWDGRDDEGRFVPPGVYIAEFRVNGASSTRKILFKGP